MTNPPPSGRECQARCVSKKRFGDPCKAWAQYLIRRERGIARRLGEPERVCGVHLAQYQKKGTVEVLKWIGENPPR